MAYDLTPHLDPKRTAILVFECQEGVIGSTSHLTGLVEAAREGQLVDHVAALLDAARAAGAGVFYCKVAKRSDGVGNPSAAEKRESATSPPGSLPLGSCTCPRNPDGLRARPKGSNWHCLDARVTLL